MKPQKRETQMAKILSLLHAVTLFFVSLPQIALPVSSATLGDRYSSRTFFAKYVSHVDLVYDLQVLSFVNRLINGSTSVSDLSKISPNMEDISYL